MRYRLVMFGFSAVCEDMEEVKMRLRGVPAARVAYEGIDQCYLIDLQEHKQYSIILKDNLFQVDGLNE